jgi:hypothetical protein
VGDWRGGLGDGSRPHHGYGEERPWYLRKRVLLLIAIAVVVALASLASRNADNQGGGESGRNESERTAAREAAATASSAKQGRSVRDGNLSITVNQVRCGVERIGRGLRARNANGQFCLVVLTVANVGEQRWGLPFIGQALVDADGERYGPDLFARGAVPGGEAVWKELAPGQRTSGTVVFELPERARPAKLELNDTPLSGPTAMELDA